MRGGLGGDINVGSAEIFLNLLSFVSVNFVFFMRPKNHNIYLRY